MAQKYKEKEIKMSKGLKLIALDQEQLAILSSLTQDAIVKADEIGYEKKSKRLAFLMNRYRHEENDPSRIRSALHFDYVEVVRSRGIKIGSSKDILALLTIKFVPSEMPSGSIYLEFSDKKSLSFNVENIEAFLTDVGESWLIPNKPSHDKD